MKLSKLSIAVASVLGAGLSVDAFAIDLYVDSKTQQIYAQPGPGRIKLGTFEKVEDKAAVKAQEEEAKALEAKALDEKIEDKIAKHELAKESAPGFAEVTIGDKGLEIETKDGNFKAALHGRMQIDSQANVSGTNSIQPQYSPTAATPVVTENALADGMSVRRARIAVDGTFFKDYEYQFEYDFTRGNGLNAAGVTDAYMQWKGLKSCGKEGSICQTSWLSPLTLKIGQFKEPFSLEEATSNRFLTFIERNMAVNSFLDNPNVYRMGLGLNYETPRWSVYTSIQTESVGGGSINDTSINNNGNANRNNGSNDTDWSVTGRIAGLPWVGGKNKFLHAGVTGSQLWVNNNYQSDGSLAANSGYSYGVALNTNVDRTNVLNTGNLTNVAQGLEVDRITRFGAETALVYGPFSAQAEYLQMDLNGKGYQGETFDGYYGYVTYFLTGESRNYKAKGSKWERIHPFHNFDMKGGWGAWEVAAGYDFLNLTDGAINGGRASTAKFGLNWYPNSHFRVMANYIHTLNIDTAADPAYRVNPSARQQAFNNANLDVFEMRAQVDW